MSGKQATFAVLRAGVSVLAASAAALDEKNEVSAKSTTRADFLGTEVYAISVEVPAVFNLDEDIQSSGDIVPTDYTQIFVTPAVRLNLFPGTRVSPWVSFGGGFGHFSESNKLNYFSTNPGGSSTTGVIQAGLGLDVRPLQKRFSHFSFRGEVRDFYSGTPNLSLADTGKTRQHNYFVGLGLVWHV
jgi:hypothetical protein